MKAIEELWQDFLEIIFPPRCSVCGTLYASRLAPGGLEAPAASDTIAAYLCESCCDGISPIASPLCSTCGLPFVSRAGQDHTCYECIMEPKYFRKARAFGIYRGPLMEAIHRMKYGGKMSLSAPLGAMARETFCRFWETGGIDLLLPVPLHIKRLRKRGFNQAHLVNRKWARLEGLPFDGFTLCRRRWTEPQTSLARIERRRNVKGAFSLRNPDRVKGQRILLVDDVFTTGATASECARVLMNAGAAFVDVLTLARAV